MADTSSVHGCRPGLSRSIIVVTRQIQVLKSIFIVKKFENVWLLGKMCVPLHRN